MRRLTVFNMVSIDGYFADARGDMSWAHQQDPEWNAWVNENASGGGVLMFGRVTYDSFAGAWPEREAAGEANSPGARIPGVRGWDVPRVRARACGAGSTVDSSRSPVSSKLPRPHPITRASFGSSRGNVWAPSTVAAANVRSCEICSVPLPCNRG